MNKIHSICTLALMLPLCAFAQYDGTPMNKTGDTKKAETAVRTDKYPHSDNDWENFDVLQSTVCLLPPPSWPTPPKRKQ